MITLELAGLIKETMRRFEASYVEEETTDGRLFGHYELTIGTCAFEVCAEAGVERLAPILNILCEYSEVAALFWADNILAEQDGAASERAGAADISTAG